jgi:hypothetical protein
MTPSTDETPAPFWAWLGRNRLHTGVAWALGIACGVVPFARLLPSAQRPWDRYVMFGVQSVICLLLAWFTPKPGSRTADERLSELDQHSRKRIQSWTRITFVAWGVMYFAMALGGSAEALVFWVANVLVGTMLFFLYFELRGADRPDDGKAKRDRINSLRMAAGAAALIISLPMLLPSVTWVAVKTSEFAIAAYNGIALAMIAGRLGSRFVGLPQAMLGVLYFYAILQGTATQFFPPGAAGSVSEIKYIATTLALPLKSLLWGVLVWYFTTGLLLDHTTGVRNLLFRKERPAAPSPTSVVERTPAIQLPKVGYEIEGKWEYECISEKRKHGGYCTITRDRSGFGLGWTINGQRQWRKELDGKIWVDREVDDSGATWDSTWAAFTDENTVRFEYRIKDGVPKFGYAYGRFEGKDVIKGRFFQLPPVDPVDGSMKFVRVTSATVDAKVAVLPTEIPNPSPAPA